VNIFPRYDVDIILQTELLIIDIIQLAIGLKLLILNR